jgi:hypothetical protein
LGRGVPRADIRKLKPIVKPESETAHSAEAQKPNSAIDPAFALLFWCRSELQADAATTIDARGRDVGDRCELDKFELAAEKNACARGRGAADGEARNDRRAGRAPVAPCSFVCFLLGVACIRS